MYGDAKKYRDMIYAKQAETVIANLKKRGIVGHYFADCAGANAWICGAIPKGSLVAYGGSVTVVDSGLAAELRKLEIRLLDRYKDGVTKEETHEMRKLGVSADVFIASCNAITKDGKIVSQDGLGNRVGGMIFGPEKVILIVGMNKLVNSVEEGMSRIKNVVAPMNCLRFEADTACARTGFCDDANCFPPERICGQLVVIETSMVEGRLTVVLVGEELGF
jgi:hypothetical protein